MYSALRASPSRIRNRFSSSGLSFHQKFTARRKITDTVCYLCQVPICFCDFSFSGAAGPRCRPLSSVAQGACHARPAKGKTTLSRCRDTRYTSRRLWWCFTGQIVRAVVLVLAARERGFGFGFGHKSVLRPHGIGLVAFSEQHLPGQAPSPYDNEKNPL